MHTSRSARRTVLAGLALAATLAVPATTLAQTGNQTNVDWDQVAVSCTGGPDGDISVQPGEAAWLFVHAGVTGPGKLTASFAGAGIEVADSYVQGNVKYLIVTSTPETLLSFEDDIDGGVLTLSHVCLPAEATPTPAPTSTPEATPTPTPEATPTPNPTSTPEAEVTPTPVATPTGTVEAQTGRPRITPPSTDVTAGRQGPSEGNPTPVLLLLGAIVALVALATPSARARTR